MGVDINVVGMNPVSEQDYAQAKKIIEDCKGLNISPPMEANDIVDAYEAGTVDISKACKGSVEYGDGMTINLKLLPPGLSKIRVYMSC